MSDQPKKLQLHTKPVGPWPMNSYALICPETGASVLIDPGADPDILMDMLSGSDPKAILLTHTHPDHIGALGKMLELLNVPLLAHENTRHLSIIPKVDQFLNSNDIVAVGNYRLLVSHAPGHIDDQICFLLQNDNRAIVGDTIFEGGPGKTWSVDGFKITLRTLETVVLDWPDNTRCFPGHGQSFRLGDQRQAIEAFLQKDHGDFYGDATWDM